MSRIQSVRLLENLSTDTTVLSGTVDDLVQDIGDAIVAAGVSSDRIVSEDGTSSIHANGEVYAGSQLVGSLKTFEDTASELVDASLSEAGKAADAKAVSDALSELVDASLSEAGKAADAKAVSDALAGKRDVADRAYRYMSNWEWTSSDAPDGWIDAANAAVDGLVFTGGSWNFNIAGCFPELPTRAPEDATELSFPSIYDNGYTKPQFEAVARRRVINDKLALTSDLTGGTTLDDDQLAAIALVRENAASWSAKQDALSTEQLSAIESAQTEVSRKAYRWVFKFINGDSALEERHCVAIVDTPTEKLIVHRSLPNGGAWWVFRYDRAASRWEYVALKADFSGFTGSSVTSSASISAHAIGFGIYGTLYYEESPDPLIHRSNMPVKLSEIYDDRGLMTSGTHASDTAYGAVRIAANSGLAVNDGVLSVDRDFIASVIGAKLDEQITALLGNSY